MQTIVLTCCQINDFSEVNKTFQKSIIIFRCDTVSIWIYSNTTNQSGISQLSYNKRYLLPNYVTALEKKDKSLPVTDNVLSLNSCPYSSTKHNAVSCLWLSSGHFSKSLEFLPGRISFTSRRSTVIKQNSLLL